MILVMPILSPSQAEGSARAPDSKHPDPSRHKDLNSFNGFNSPRLLDPPETLNPKPQNLHCNAGFVPAKLQEEKATRRLTTSAPRPEEIQVASKDKAKASLAASSLTKQSYTILSEYSITVYYAICFFRSCHMLLLRVTLRRGASFCAETEAFLAVPKAKKGSGLRILRRLAKNSSLGWSGLSSRFGHAAKAHRCPPPSLTRFHTAGGRKSREPKGLLCRVAEWARTKRSMSTYFLLT